MEKSDDKSLFCSNCNNPVKEDDDFCPECGTLIIDEVYCENHNNILAKGVCIICATPYCKKCGTMINNHFLCNFHNSYEIYEGMARIFGTLDDVTAQYVKSCLEQEGFHPIIFCRDHVKGGPRFVYNLFEAKGDYMGNIVNEIKVMVPCQEVLDAEKILKNIME